MQQLNILKVLLILFLAHYQLVSNSVYVLSRIDH